MPGKIVLIVGARPNFMKSAPLLKQLQKYPDNFAPLLVHTGQHYNYELSQLFFEQLRMREPDVYLDVGSGSHAVQTAQIMIKLEDLLLREKPDMVIVFGDVNSTLAAAIVASKIGIPIAHVEAGLRSFDNSMPEEINRIVTDRLSDYLFVTEDSGMRNLENEGVAREKAFLTGNIMIDSLVSNMNEVEKSGILDELSLIPGKFAALTLHRPSNVDDKDTLNHIFGILSEIGEKIPIVFPCHPRTQKNLESMQVLNGIDTNAIMIIEPVGYLDFIRLQKGSKFILTDSGGIQEESTYMGIPCITLRDNTERPVTVESGTNTLTGLDPARIMDAVDNILSGSYKKGRIPPLWDGHTSERIVDILLERFSGVSQ